METSAQLRDLDYRVAEKVMEVAVVRDDATRSVLDATPHFSTDIHHAIAVAERLKSLGFVFRTFIDPLLDGADGGPIRFMAEFSREGQTYTAGAARAAEAICLAALDAVAASAATSA